MKFFDTIKAAGFKNGMQENLKVAEMRFDEAKPEILLGCGVIGVLAGTIIACMQTAKAKKAIEDHKTAIKGIEFEHSVDETISEDAKKQAKIVKGKKYATEYAHLIYELVKIYGVSALLWCGGMGAIVGSHAEMVSRNRALLANSVALQQLFDDYRRRNAEIIGEENEQKLFMGAKEETIQVLEKDPETGEEKLVEKKGDVFYAQPGSIYARNFTESTSDAFDIRSFADRYLESRINAINTDLELGVKRFYSGAEIMRMLGFNEDQLSDDMLEVGISGNARLVPDAEMRKLKVTRLKGFERKYDHTRDCFVFVPCLRLDFNFYPLKGKV